MKSIALIPYCPLPADHGGKVEMWKALKCLRELGPCTILSARTRPVGMGWTPARLEEVRACGFDVVFREDDEPRRFRPERAWGMAYAAAGKVLGMARAFGHANPYHRLAFDPTWVARELAQLDLDVISSPEEYRFEPGLFYDSAYHLNAEGRQLRTERLLRDLARWQARQREGN